MMIATKVKLRSALSQLAVRAGFTAFSRTLAPKRGALIFYAHRLASDVLGFLPGIRPEWFEEQIDFLSKHYRFIALTELLAYLEQGRKVPDRTAVMTLDDGFKDNLTVGLPVFKKHGIPATIFVVTQSMANGDLPWPQRLGSLFQQTTVSEVNVDGLGHFSLQTTAERQAAFHRISGKLFGKPRMEREEQIAWFSEVLHVEPPQGKMLSWDDCRQMADAGIEFGGHTYSHAWLSFLDPREAREELELCRDDLQREMGIEHAAFCFPAGSCNTELIEVLREVGFRSAFLPNLPFRINTLKNATPFRLSRVGLPQAPALQLEANLDGPFYATKQLLNTVLGRRKEPSNDSRWREQESFGTVPTSVSFPGS